MALSRNARRRNAKLRCARQEADKANSAMVLERRAIVNRNLSRPKGRTERTPIGSVSAIYSGAAKPLGYTRRDLSSRGVAPLQQRKPLFG